VAILLVHKEVVIKSRFVVFIKGLKRSRRSFRQLVFSNIGKRFRKFGVIQSSIKIDAAVGRRQVTDALVILIWLRRFVCRNTSKKRSTSCEDASHSACQHRWPEFSNECGCRAALDRCSDENKKRNPSPVGARSKAGDHRCHDGAPCYIMTQHGGREPNRWAAILWRNLLTPDDTASQPITAGTVLDLLLSTVLKLLSTATKLCGMSTKRTPTINEYVH